MNSAEPELTEMLCSDIVADINIKREENSDPLALSNTFDNQAHIDSQQDHESRDEHLAGDLKPGDCDLQTKIEVHEDFTIKTESSDLSEFIEKCNAETRDQVCEN